MRKGREGERKGERNEGEEKKKKKKRRRRKEEKKKEKEMIVINLFLYCWLLVELKYLYFS